MSAEQWAGVEELEAERERAQKAEAGLRRKVRQLDRELEAFREAQADGSHQGTAHEPRLTGRQRRGADKAVELLPRKIEREWPSLKARADQDLSRDALKARMDEVGPWRVPFRLGQDLMTVKHEVAIDRILYRRDLINGTVTDRLGDRLSDTTFLDLGCNCGFFSLDMAARGAGDVYGVDLREENIAQAKFLAEHYDVENVDFGVEDVDEFPPDRQWDVVFNLGLLYHVLDPLGLLRKTYELCREFAVVDTLAPREPASGFLLMGSKDVDKPTSGRDEWELHPTYLGVIDGMRYAGFSEIIEVVGEADPPHALYAEGKRSCFIGIK